MVAAAVVLARSGGGGGTAARGPGGGSADPGPISMCGIADDAVPLARTRPASAVLLDALLDAQLDTAAGETRPRAASLVRRSALA